MTDQTDKPEAKPTNPVQGGDASPGQGPARPPPVRRSVWTPKEKLIRLVWATVARPFWLCVPALRPALIRGFGGTIGKNCAFAASVEVTIPWHVRCGDGVRVGERVILYGLGPITIGSGTIIDYKAHVCAGTHDMTDSRFPLLKTPITIGERCFIGIDAYIAPEVTLGDRCRVWPRASVYRSFPADTDLQGNPAKPMQPESAARSHSMRGDAPA